MGVAKKLTNRVGKFNYEMPENVEYINTQTLMNMFGDAVQTVKIMYISKKSKYGPSGIIGILASNGVHYWINTPNHIVKHIQTLREDPDTYAQVNDNKLGIKPYTYELADNDIHYSLEFVDIE